MKLYLHIGLQKTGTTSIQHALGLSREILRKDGLYFPDDDELPDIYAGNAMGLKPFASGKGEAFRQWVVKGPDEYRQHFAERLRISTELAGRAGCRGYILSSERCSTLAGVSDIERLRTLMEEFFSAVDIIIYLRDQLSYCVALYATAVAGGGTHSLDSALSDNRFRRSGLNFDLLCRRWEESWGQASVKVRLFPGSSPGTHALLEDFASVIDFDGRLLCSVKKNQSWSLGTTEVLRRINQRSCNSVGGGKHYRKAIHEFLATQVEPYMRRITPSLIDSVNPELKRKVTRQFADSNDRLAIRHNLPRPLFPDAGRSANAETGSHRQLVKPDAEFLNAMAEMVAAFWVKQ